MPALDVSTLTIVTPGTQLGPYRIEATIGEGGMGRVFRAVDTRLGRVVAIKTSTEGFGERFDRQARAISALNHPHICTLYDVGPNYLVMELCDGETLAARIRKGKLSADDTLRYGAQIAAALAAAHAEGITHRDLKPANIMLAKRGVKVLDFGIAKSAGDEALTASHIAIGTPAYMSPEQREGKVVDHRSDIYALGLVLYEMAAGKRPPQEAPAQFDGLPAQFAHVVERCLDQDPAERWQAANDVRKELEWSAKAPGPTAVAPKRRPVSWWIVAALTAAATLAGFLWLRPNTSSREPVEFTFTSPPDAVMNHEIAAVSPDGRAIAFTAHDPSGQSFVWVRTLDSPVARRLEGTEQASKPFWSPDSRFIAFFASNKLKKIGITGGPPQTICTTLPGLGGAWSPSGDIVFNPSNRAPLWRVSARGGTPAAVTTLEAERQENSHRWPSFLPDGHHFLFTVRSSLKENTAIYIGSLDSKETKRVLTEQSNAVYAPPGYLVFSREGSVMAQPFNLSRMEVAGEAVPVASGIDQETPSANGFFSVSADGTTLAHSQVDRPVDQLTWIDRTGSNPEPFGPLGKYTQPRLSPDGKRLAYASNDSDSGNRDIWLMDLSTNARIRLTSNPANDWWPAWSPDGAEIAFASDRKPRSSLYRKRADGSGEEELLLFPEGKGGAFNPDWSPDARYLAYDQDNPDTRGLDLWLLPLTRESASRSPCWLRISPKAPPGFRRTGNGSRTLPMSPALGKSTCAN